MILTVEQEDLGVLAPSSSLSPLDQKTKREQKKNPPLSLVLRSQ